MSETILVAIISSSALSTLISTIIAFISKKSEKQSLTEKGVMCLMGFTIRNQCEKIIKEGHLSLTEFRQLQELNITYHTMGGNGYVKALMEKVEKLPIVE